MATEPRNHVAVSKMADQEIRDMLLRAGVDVTSESDQVAFARLIRWTFAREEVWISRQINRGKLLIVIFGAVASLIGAAALPIISRVIGIIGGQP